LTENKTWFIACLHHKKTYKGRYTTNVALSVYMNRLQLLHHNIIRRTRLNYR